jgi:hypothetical protein
LKYCDADDDAVWKATGKNAFGTCVSECHLTVEIPDGLKKPSFIVKLDDIQADEMQIVKFEVKIDAIPIPDIVWYCDSRQLQHGGRYRMQFDDDTKHYSLTILDVVAEDSGVITCCATNIMGKATSECTLIVRGSQ